MTRRRRLVRAIRGKDGMHGLAQAQHVGRADERQARAQLCPLDHHIGIRRGLAARPAMQGGPVADLSGQTHERRPDNRRRDDIIHGHWAHTRREAVGAGDQGVYRP